MKTEKSRLSTIVSTCKAQQLSVTIDTERERISIHRSTESFPVILVLDAHGPQYLSLAEASLGLEVTE